MRRVLLAGFVFGCSATGTGPLASGEVARASEPEAAPPGAAAPESPESGQVIVDVYGLVEERGTLNVGLYDSEAGFPEDPNAAFTQRSVPINRRALRLVFDRVPAGAFAVAVHHDENANGKMDTGMFGMPAEGYGFSRDAKANFGPPSFADARLTLGEGQRKRVVVHMKY